MDTEADIEWKAEAECESVKPSDVFFAKEHEQMAKQICSYCTVKEQCLGYAIRQDVKFGIWGGMTPRERKRYMKR